MIGQGACDAETTAQLVVSELSELPHGLVLHLCRRLTAFGVLIALIEIFGEPRPVGRDHTAES